MPFVTSKPWPEKARDSSDDRNSHGGGDIRRLGVAEVHPAVRIRPLHDHQVAELIRGGALRLALQRIHGGEGLVDAFRLDRTREHRVDADTLLAAAEFTGEAVRERVQAGLRHRVGDAAEIAACARR